jgi:YVTN family beta-propeller protein
MMLVRARLLPAAALLPLAALALAAPGAHGAAARARPGAPPAHPEVAVGGFPTGIALDPATDTVYVGNGDTGTLSVIDGRGCNAGDVRRCGRRVSAVTAGLDPVGIAVDAATRTLYVANASGTVAVVNGRTCDAAATSGCHLEPATVPVGVDPQFIAIDEQTDTVYVANSLSNTISVIDGRTCNAASRAGCRRVRASIPVGPGPFALVVSEPTRTLYVAYLAAPAVSVIDAATCNATDVGGCRRPQAAIAVGQVAGGIALDARTETVYVTDQLSGEVAVIDARTCNARVRSGCGAAPARVRAGGGARGIAVDEATDTVYVANTAAGTVSVIDGSTCNASVRSGCGQRAAVAPVGISPRRLAVDDRTSTVYVTNAGSNTVTMLDGATCNGRVHRGCGSERIA